MSQPTSSKEHRMAKISVGRVRHPNAKQGGHIVNPAWFTEWTLLRETVQS